MASTQLVEISVTYNSLHGLDNQIFNQTSTIVLQFITIFYIELIELLEVHNSSRDVMVTSGLKANSVLITSLALIKMA